MYLSHGISHTPPAQRGSKREKEKERERGRGGEGKEKKR